MTSTNISIRKDAYDFLKSLKSEDKSFSDVIIELKNANRNKNNNIMKFFGILKEVDWETRKKSMKELRNSFEKRL